MILDHAVEFAAQILSRRLHARQNSHHRVVELFVSHDYLFGQFTRLVTVVLLDFEVQPARLHHELQVECPFLPIHPFGNGGFLANFRPDWSFFGQFTRLVTVAHLANGDRGDSDMGRNTGLVTAPSLANGDRSDCGMGRNTGLVTVASLANGDRGDCGMVRNTRLVTVALRAYQPEAQARSNTSRAFIVGKDGKSPAHNASHHARTNQTWAILFELYPTASIGVWCRGI